MRSALAMAAALALGGAAAADAAEAPPPHGLALGAPMVDWMGAAYDPAIPTLAQVAGYAAGREITSPADANRYLDALAAAAPERMRLVEIGRSWQGRPLRLAIIAAPEAIARLDAIQADLQRLADPRRTSEAEAARLAATLPAPVWLAYSVHGDEISGADAALDTAYRLLAAKDDPRIAKMLRETLVILHPMQNPDGRERFVASTRSARGLSPDADPVSAERDQPWPRGRVNHYLFDLNRDWFALTQPETRAHVRAMLGWHPVVVADLHEMSGESTYFFPPAAAPTNPLQTAAQMRLREAIGRNHARWFDRIGAEYFTRDVYDLFYPGYGDGWPSYHGAVSMTYEQGSARGLAFARRDGRVLTFAETVRNQTVTSLSTIEVAAERREELLRGLHRYRAEAMAEGRGLNDRTILIPPQQDQAGADRLARLLAAQGVEVGRASAGFRHCGRSYPAGTYVIDKAQPAQRLVSVLMRERIPLDPAFAAEQERRRARGLPDEIYDVTAWSLPLLYNLEVVRCAGAPNVARAPVAADAPDPGAVTGVGATEAVAYLAPWGDTAAVQALTRLLERGVRLRSADAAFTLEGRRYPAGTLIIPTAGAPESLRADLEVIARETGARIEATATTWVTDGPSFGAEDAPVMRPVRVALAWDDPGQPTAAGATRYVLEQRFGQKLSVVRARSLIGALERFDVVVLPSGDFAEAFDGGDRAALQGWVRRGGVLIGLGDAMAFLAEPDSKLLSVRREELARPEGEEAPEEADEDAATRPGALLETEADYRAAIDPVTRPPDAVAGVILRAEADQEHWLAAGIAPRLAVPYGGRDIYTPARRDEGANVVRFAGPDEVLASGYLWRENAAQLAFKPAVVVEEIGRGVVIGFAVDPTLRGYAEGMNVLFANAIYRAAAHARPAR